MVKNKLCFVIMPFSSTDRCTEEEWTDVFKNVHKPAIMGSRNGYKCERSNIRPGAFIKDILMQLNQADVVLADLTDMNPNVLYELGVRHTLRNRTILVSQTIDNIPSDLIQYGVIKYDTTPKGVTEFKKKINKILKDIKNNPDRADNPVSDFLHQQNIVNDSFEAKAIEKKLIALISECSFNLSIFDITMDHLQKTNLTINRFRIDALELLITTNYIYPNDRFIENANLIMFNLTSMNNFISVFGAKKKNQSDIEAFSKIFLEFSEPLKNFMRQTHEILKDFRNQNFIEAAELTICIAKNEHKKLLDI